MIRTRLEPVLNREHEIGKSELPLESLNQLRRLDQHQGIAASFLPQTAILAVNSDGKHGYFTVIHNNEHSNISSVLRENSNRLPD